MKRRFSIDPAVVTVIVALAVPAFLAAQQPYRDLPVFKRRPAQAQPHTAHTAERPGFPVSASGNIVPTRCPPDALALDPSVSCGFVPVPLERNHPAGETINIYFELYPHTNAGPAESAIVPNLGGPGPSTTANRSGWLGFFGPNLDAHDLLLIDDRGRGPSGTIGITNCRALQHGTVTSFDKALAECAADLGDDNSHYGTGDIAQDIEAVRAALGYDKLDYHGGSYGGVDAIAYATRAIR